VNINDHDDDPALIWFRHGLTFDGKFLLHFVYERFDFIYQWRFLIISMTLLSLKK
jgi:hypothetical protein